MSKISISNFGGEVCFQPAEIIAPKSVDALLEELSKTKAGKIRVIGSKHAWNGGIKTSELLVDPKHLNSIQIQNDGDQPWVLVGGGCVMRNLADELTKHGLALPTCGLILEQTIAGATATGTHGSGKPSLSHFLSGVRIVHFKNGQPTSTWIESGVDLQAARCSLGCLGIIVEVRLPVIPTYFITEDTVRCSTLREAIQHEPEHPLQQIFVLPLSWKIYAQRRKINPVQSVAKTSWLYRKYWNWGLCFFFIAILKLKMILPFTNTLFRLFYRHLAPWLLITDWKVIDRSDKLMIIHHETFRHLEIELFVRKDDIIAAFELVVEILKVADDSTYQPSQEVAGILDTNGLLKGLENIKGTFTHHCPICLRSVLADDTLISMTAGQEDWYSISLITYAEPRDPFFQLATFLAVALHKSFGARTHWGKWFPYDAAAVEEQYEKLDLFRDACQRFDPEGVFRNRFSEKLFRSRDINPMASSNIRNLAAKGYENHV